MGDKWIIYRLNGPLDLTKRQESKELEKSQLQMWSDHNIHNKIYKKKELS